MTTVNDGMKRDLAAERAKIERSIAGKTLPSVFAATVDQYPHDKALSWKTDQGWQSLTWEEYRQRVREVALGLNAIGFGPGEFGVIMARNRPEHVIPAQGTPVRLYNTLAAEQVQYVTGHCEATVAIVEDAGFLAKFREVRDQLPGLRRVIVMEPGSDGRDDWVMSWEELLALGRAENERDPGAFDRHWKQGTPRGLAALIFPPGTTGPPKGVMDTHRQVLWMAESATEWLPRPAGARHISYLPFAHAFERFIGHWYAIHQAQSVYFCPDPALLFTYAAEVKPSGMIGVPRVWEKLQAGLSAGIAAEPDAGRRAAIEAAIGVGLEVVRYKQQGQEPPAELLAKADQCRP